MTLAQFVVDRIYTDRAATDHSYIYRWKVTARTAKTVTMISMNNTGAKPFKRGVRTGQDGVERCNPNGRYSMAAIASADRFEGAP